MIYYASIKLKKPAVCFSDTIQTLVQAEDTEEVSSKVQGFLKTQNVEALDMVIRPLKLNDTSIVLLKSEELISFTLKKEQITSEENEKKKKKAEEIQKALKTKMPFGQYKDDTIEEIMAKNASYLHWLIGEGTAKGLLAKSLGTLEARINDLFYEEQAAKIPEEYADALAGCLPNS